MDELCQEKHKAIEEKFNRHEKWLGEHEGKLDVLNRNDARNSQALEDLASKIGGQTKAIWGLVSIFATALVGFFFYAVQAKLLK